MESKFPDESKTGESKFGEPRSPDNGVPSPLIADTKKLDKLMGKRDSGDVLANLYPFYQRKVADELDLFFQEHAHKFDYDSDEHRLCYTSIFKKYESLFEGYLAEFIEEQQLDERTFYQELNDIVEHKKTGRSQVLVKMVVAQTDYDFFVSLMKDKARELAMAKAATGTKSNKGNKK